MRAPLRIESKILIGLGVAAVFAAIVIPNLLEPKVSWNDTAALAALRNLASVQEKFRAARVVDLDHDGIGEYGTFALGSSRTPAAPHFEIGLLPPGLPARDGRRPGPRRPRLSVDGVLRSR